MTDKTIINGIDVTKCEYYNTKTGKCRIPHFEQGIKFVSCNCNEWDCHFKQLQAEKQLVKALEKDCPKRCRQEKYKQALEKIKNEINNTPKHYWGQRHVEFLEIINEALKEEKQKGTKQNDSTK